ncbi:uncharacterized protein B0I36DRAFT_365106 [Microdochium trichocladiopsis]|uniref:Uncharacterized protein n=1 Tax=Microdochium trichocladiopsis TaxID=1682393 RepID=A0A9P8Y2F5_9PEZI|nr:uncharacterized protein B0I36DRAFT_365106 [Microdochium trichocladiopsis]KAH7027977.1 hypothetical protein B0I36DRAFT_365106 [Microdochium trichocladiopsis]
MTGIPGEIPDYGPSTAGHVSYTMPECISCGCDTCTATSTFVTSYPAFCPGQKSGFGSDKPGFTEQTYTVTETYVGVSSVPQFASATDVPFGFTISVATCTACSHAANQGGNGPVVIETMTYPQDSTPFAINSACAEQCDDDAASVSQAGGGTTSMPALVTGNGTAPPVLVTVSGTVTSKGHARWAAIMLGSAAIIALSL